MTARDYRDDVIEAFAASEAVLLERLGSLEDERDTWRLIAVQSIHHSHDLYRQCERREARIVALRDELRERMGIPPARVLADVEVAEAA